MIAGDLETTGLLKPDTTELIYQPKITEIYLCKFDYSGKIISEFETLINPQIPIPEIISKLTGIDDNTVKDAPTFIEIYDDLVDFVLGEKTIFTHNAAFDMGMLKTELRRHELEFAFPYPPYQICTVEASYHIQNKRLKLEALYELATGKQKQTAHRAKDDVMDLVKCICWLKKEGFIHDIFN